jgi:hypothetical protein
MRSFLSEHGRLMCFFIRLWQVGYCYWLRSHPDAACKVCHFGWCWHSFSIPHHDTLHKLHQDDIASDHIRSRQMFVCMPHVECKQLQTYTWNASHKSNPSSVPQDYVEMVTGVEGVPWGGLLWHMLAIHTLGHMGGGNRCGGDTL